MKSEVIPQEYQAWIAKSRWSSGGDMWPLSRRIYGHGEEPLSQFQGGLACDGAYSWYCNEEVDALIVKAGRTFDIEGRKQIYQQIAQILYEEVPGFLYYQVVVAFAMRDKVQWKPEQNSGVHPALEYVGQDLGGQPS